MAALLVAGALPDVRVPGQVDDKTLHYVAYGVLGICVYRALAGGLPGPPTRRVVALTMVITLLHGAAMEAVQQFVPGREADVLDLLVDAIGALSAVIVCGAWHIIRTSSDA